MKKFLKLIKDYFEFICFRLFLSLSKTVSIDKSANFCSSLARKIGPYLKATKVARKNLNNIYGKNIDINLMIDQLWDNFGRFIGEFAHIPSLNEDEMNKRLEIVGWEDVKKTLPKNKPFLLFTGHFANWDFALRNLTKLDKFAIIYRRANNKFVDAEITKLRANNGVTTIAKGPHGVRDLLKAIKSKKSIAMLIDQKMNDGVSVPFFGKPAMTAPAIAKIALQYHYPIVPCQIIRKQGSYFRVIIHPQLIFSRTNDKHQDCINIMVKINNIVENWVRENPSQWFWFHNRWNKDK